MKEDDQAADASPAPAAAPVEQAAPAPTAAAAQAESPKPAPPAAAAEGAEAAQGEGEQQPQPSKTEPAKKTDSKDDEVHPPSTGDVKVDDGPNPLTREEKERQEAAKKKREEQNKPKTEKTNDEEVFSNPFSTDPKHGGSPIGKRPAPAKTDDAPSVSNTTSATNHTENPHDAGGPAPPSPDDVTVEDTTLIHEEAPKKEEKPVEKPKTEHTNDEDMFSNPFASDPTFKPKQNITAPPSSEPTSAAANILKAPTTDTTIEPLFSAASTAASSSKDAAVEKGKKRVVDYDAGGNYVTVGGMPILPLPDQSITNKK